MTTAASPCVHAWDIEPAKGPTSQGTCTRCGETREFRNRPSGDEVEALLALEGAQRLHPEKHAMTDGPYKRPEKEEEKQVEQKHKVGATRAAELAETKQRFFQMFAEGRSVEDIEAMLKEAPGGPPTGSSLHYWWIKARERAKKAAAPAKPTPQSEVATPVAATKGPANMPEIMPEQPKPEPSWEDWPDEDDTVTIPIDLEALRRELQKSPDERLWQMVMLARPDWKDKPRLGRWMDMVDAVYAFLVECD